MRGELQTDQISGGLLDLVQVSATYDPFLRRQFLQAARGASVLVSQTYGYDSASRLETIVSNGQTATYTYYPNTGLLNTTAFTGGTNIARSYDSLGRLQTITTSPAADTPQSYTYTYNNLHQRTKVTREDGAYWSYGYNDRGELVSGKKYWADNTLVFGNQTEYDYDAIGNRKAAKSGGNEAGNLRQSTYATNSLNQYVQRSVPGAVDVTGTANSAATVSVNNQATARKGEYFYRELAVDNSVGAVSPQINVVGARQNYGAGGEDAVTERGGRAFVPQAVETYSYDADGNMTSDGRWIYTWDAENRLVSMEALVGVPMEAKSRLEFAYDYMGRRIQKKVYAWNAVTASYQLQAVTKFVSDGWNVVAELDGNNALIRSYVWGQDISGSLQGAGGIGGLLLSSEGGNTYQAGYDGNGNIVALTKAGTGMLSASYEYDPFGNTLKAVGEYAERHPFQFSTKYADAETGLIYFGYRYYNPQVGRWVSKDPKGESGGINLYAFVTNNPVERIDLLRLYGRVVSYKRIVSLRLDSKDEAEAAAEGAKVRSLLATNEGVDLLVTGKLQALISSKIAEIPLDVVVAKIVYSEKETGKSVRSGVFLMGKLNRDENGHIIGKQLGGDGEPHNLFPQDFYFNRGSFWRNFEDSIRNYIDTHQCEAGYIQVTLAHQGSFNIYRPSALRYKVHFRDSRGRFTRTFADGFFINGTNLF